MSCELHQERMLFLGEHAVSDSAWIVNMGYRATHQEYGLHHDLPEFLRPC